MNDKIKELLEQAGVKYVTMPKDTVYEKFAELIVRECNFYACSAWEHGPLLGRDLLIYFGIEETDDESTN